MDYGISTDDISLESFPAGAYKAIAVSEETKETKSGDNMLVVKWEIMEGNQKGMSQNVNLNLFHGNPVAKNIAEQTLKKIANATDNVIDGNNPIKGRKAIIHV
ncbi:DUF669 domain-containing protein, partial [bacterium]|nr:DUF669 domain-containing protein [bacterium]